jgi:hypothetical protein
MQNVFMGVGAAALFALGVAVGTSGQDEKKKPAEPTKSAAEQDAGGMPTPKPLPEHALLAKGVGKWKAKMTLHMGPKTETSTGVETITMGCGGLWQMGDFVEDKTGAMGGFTGHGFVGYDPDHKRFVGSWCDSMSYAVTAMSGTLDASGKVLTMDAVGYDSTMKAEMKMKHVTTFVDDNHRTFSMRMPGEDGKDMEVMLIEYTRQ